MFRLPGHELNNHVCISPVKYRCQSAHTHGRSEYDRLGVMQSRKSNARDYTPKIGYIYLS